MKRIIYLLLSLFLGFMAYIFYNQTKIVAQNKQEITLSNGAKITLQTDAVLKYNKLLFGIANNLYMEGEAFIEVPADAKLGVHTLNGSAKTTTQSPQTPTKFYVNADEHNLTIQVFENNLTVSSFDLEESLAQGEMLLTVKEKPKKTTFNVQEKPALMQ